MDLINRQDAIDAIEKLDIPEDMCVFEILSHIELAIGTLPSAERKRGKWIHHENPKGIFSLECPFCKCWFLHEHLVRNSYCPNCGAKNGW